MESLLVRYLTGGRVVMAMPSLVVERSSAHVVTWIARGTPIAYPRGRLNGRLRPFEEWGVDLRSWQGPGRLELTPLPRRYSIRLFRNDDGRFRGWYVNLQAPLTESRFGYDTTDWQLDLWIEPEGRVQWKDEEDLARAIALGIMTADEGRLARDEAHRVLDEWPFPTGWEDWSAPVDAPALTLPDSWDVV